jgi:hypothetical protein
MKIEVKGVFLSLSLSKPVFVELPSTFLFTLFPVHTETQTQTQTHTHTHTHTHTRTHMHGGTQRHRHHTQFFHASGFLR